MIFRKRWVLWFLSQVVLPALKRLWMLSRVALAEAEISDISLVVFKVCTRCCYCSAVVAAIRYHCIQAASDIVADRRRLRGGWVMNKDNKYNNYYYCHSTMNVRRMLKYLCILFLFSNCWAV